MLRIFNFCSDLWYIFVVHLHGSAPILVAQVHDSVAHFVFFSRSLSLSVVVSKSITSYANKLRFNNLSLILFSLERKKGSLLKLPFVIRLGFEPKTHSLEGCCSIQLSYQTIIFSDSKHSLKIECKISHF